MISIVSVQYHALRLTERQLHYIIKPVFLSLRLPEKLREQGYNDVYNQTGPYLSLLDRGGECNFDRRGRDDVQQLFVP